MRRCLRVVKGCFLAAALTAARVSAVTLTGAILIVPMVGCDEVDLTTTEGRIKALEDGQKLARLNEILLEITDSDEMIPLGPAMQKRYLAGAPAIDKTLISKLIGLKDPAFKDAYVKALKTAPPDVAKNAALTLTSLKIIEAEDAFVETYQKTTDPILKLTLLQSGRKIGSKKMSLEAAKLLAGDFDEISFSSLQAACAFLEEIPNTDPSVIRNLIEVTFFKDSSGNPLFKHCIHAIHAVGPAALPIMKEAIDGKNTYLESLLKKRTSGVSRMDVIRGVNDMIHGISDPRGPKIIMGILADRKPIQEPMAIRGDQSDAGAQQRHIWSSTVLIGFQELMQGANRFGFKGNEEEAKKVLMSIFRWDKWVDRKFFVIGGHPMIHPVYRSVALRALVENNLLEEADITEVIAILSDESWTKSGDKGLRFRRALLAANVLSYLGNALSKPDQISTVYQPLADLALGDITDPEIAKSFEIEVEGIQKMVDQSKAAFELTDECASAGDPASCYTQAIQENKIASKGKGDTTSGQNPVVWRTQPILVQRAIQALGQTHDAKHFDNLLDLYRNTFDGSTPIYLIDAIYRVTSKANAQAIYDASRSSGLNRLHSDAIKAQLGNLSFFAKNKK